QPESNPVAVLPDGYPRSHVFRQLLRTLRPRRRLSLVNRTPRRIVPQLYPRRRRLLAVAFPRPAARSVEAGLLVAEKLCATGLLVRCQRLTAKYLEQRS